MPYEITWEQHGAIKKLSGFMSNDDVRSAFKALHKDARYNSLLYVLHDSSEVTGHEYKKEDVLLLLANHLGASVQNPRLRDIVVSRDQAFVEEIRSSMPVRLLPNPVEFFNTLAEARARINEIVEQREIADQ